VPYEKDHNAGQYGQEAQHADDHANNQSDTNRAASQTLLNTTRHTYSVAPACDPAGDGTLSCCAPCVHVSNIETTKPHIAHHAAQRRIGHEVTTLITTAKIFANTAHTSGHDASKRKRAARERITHHHHHHHHRYTHQVPPLLQLLTPSQLAQIDAGSSVSIEHLTAQCADAPESG
jgi:hypothetical protein